jgi:hypothetical protein
MTVQEKIEAPLPNPQIADDMAMLRAAVELTRDISAACSQCSSSTARCCSFTS